MPACLLLICARRLHSHVMRRFLMLWEGSLIKWNPDPLPWNLCQTAPLSTLMSKLGLPPLIKWGLGPCLEMHRWLCSHVLKFVPHRENAKQSKPASIEFVNEIHHTSQEPMPFILWTSCKSKYWDLNRVGHRISLFLFFYVFCLFLILSLFNMVELYPTDEIKYICVFSVS